MTNPSEDLRSGSFAALFYVLRHSVSSRLDIKTVTNVLWSFETSLLSLYPHDSNELVKQIIFSLVTSGSVRLCFTRLVQGKLEDDEYEDDVDNDINNRRMLSRFGVWLLVGVCSEPARCEAAERLGRLVSMVLSWIETTSTLRRDYVGELLKRLTSQYVCRWLLQVRDSKLELLCACLTPDPPAYVKVGGCWDTMSSKARQHMEGLHRLCCLVPHNLITPEVRRGTSVNCILLNSA